MYKYYKVLFVILMTFHWSSVNARFSFNDKMFNNAKENNQPVNEPTFQSLKENIRSYRSIQKPDPFDILLDLDIVNDMKIYRYELVDDLKGADKTLVDRKLDEAENISWKHKYAFHRYALQIFDEVKRFHSVRSNISDYNV